MKKRSFLKAVLMMGSLCITLSAGAAAAFFTDRASYMASGIRAGTMDFSYPDDKKPEGASDKDFAIIADSGDFEDRISPYREGDELFLRFKAYFGGETEGILVPRLELLTKGLEPDGIISVFMTEDGKEEVRLGEIAGKDGSSFFYGEPSVTKPDSEKEFVYRIRIDRLPEEALLELNFDFSIASGQLKNNEELPDKTGEEAYEKLKDKYDGEASDIIGFTEHTDLSEAVDEDGNDFDTSLMKKTAVRLIPNILDEGNSRTYVFWYVKDEEGRRPLKANADGSLSILISKRYSSRSFEYEIWNRAGHIVSEEVSFGYDDATDMPFVRE